MTESPSYKTAIIKSIRQETRDVKTFVLSYADGSAIPYVAGQFITFVFNHHGKEERRSYSISSCAALGEPLSFTVKRVDNGAYSRLLIDRAVVGDVLYTTGAGGLFTLPETDTTYEQYFFFAAGIGITPVFSLIKTLLHTDATKHVVLIYSNRVKEEVVFLEELNTLIAQFPDRLKVEFLYSTSFNLARARLSKSLLHLLLKEYGRVPHYKMLFYLCGPFTYMRMAIFALEEMGIHDAQIRKENFNTNDRRVNMPEPPDKATHNATLIVEGKQQTITVSYPDTILLAAKKQHIALPYSCEVGRCGSCAAMCTEGAVWLSYNEVLMDTDLKKGMTLTCVGHPVGGDVTIVV